MLSLFDLKVHARYFYRIRLAAGPVVYWKVFQFTFSKLFRIRNAYIAVDVSLAVQRGKLLSNQTQQQQLRSTSSPGEVYSRAGFLAISSSRFANNNTSSINANATGKRLVIYTTSFLFFFYLSNVHTRRTVPVGENSTYATRHDPSVLRKLPSVRWPENCSSLVLFTLVEIVQYIYTKMENKTFHEDILLYFWCYLTDHISDLSIY